MSAKVTIETDDLTLSKQAGGKGIIDEAWVVHLIVDLVEAFDAANKHRGYNVRNHLVEELLKQKR